ncbi:MAG: Opine dehydrogenase [Anaerolineae bacterium]|nr:Opine dehydrogenase [Anaerolineae bacterium]
MPKLTICGGGNAAHVIMALAPNTGWEVDVFAPLANEADRLQAGVAAGGVSAIFGDRQVTGQPRRVSANPAEVIPGSELVLLALPAFAHGATLQTIAPFLDAGAAVGALPARGGFDYQARALLADAPAINLFGLQTLPWACRIIRYGQAVEVLGTKAGVDVAVSPVGQADDLLPALAALLGLQLKPAASFLTLTLANTGQLIHPGIMYGLGRGREADTFAAADIPLFYQGVDPPTANLLQTMSDEVQAVAAAIAARDTDFNPREVLPLLGWLLHSYPTNITDSSSLQSAFNTNRAYVGLRLPTRPAGPDRFAIDYTTRYLAEDIPFGLVVLRGIAELAGVATPTIDAVVIWAQARLQKEYLVDGQLVGAHLSETRAPQTYGIFGFGF